MKITQKIQPISDYPKLGDTHEIFRKKADIAWRDLATAIPQMNQWAIEANNLRDEVNDLRNDTLNYKNTTLNYKNLTYGYKVDAVNAWNNIKGYVIPNEATYNKDKIDKQLSEITRVQVAQQIILAYLQQN